MPEQIMRGDGILRITYLKLKPDITINGKEIWRSSAVEVGLGLMHPPFSLAALLAIHLGINTTSDFNEVFRGTNPFARDTLAIYLRRCTQGDYFLLNADKTNQPYRWSLRTEAWLLKLDEFAMRTIIFLRSIDIEKDRQKAVLLFTSDEKDGGNRSEISHTEPFIVDKLSLLLNHYRILKGEEWMRAFKENSLIGSFPEIIHTREKQKNTKTQKQYRYRANKQLKNAGMIEDNLIISQTGITFCEKVLIPYLKDVSGETNSSYRERFNDDVARISLITSIHEVLPSLTIVRFPKSPKKATNES